MSTCIRQTAASRPNSFSILLSFFCSPICPNNCGVVFFVKICQFLRNVFFRSTAQICRFFTLNITRVVWPHITNLLDPRYFCRHNPLFYHLYLIPCHYWSWQRNVYLWFYKTKKLFRLLYYTWVLLFAGSLGFPLCFPLSHLYQKLVTQ